MAPNQAQLTILPNMNTFYNTISEESQSKFHNSYKFCGSKMAAHQAQLNGVTNNPTKYEHILSHGFWEVAFTNCQGQSLLRIPFLTVLLLLSFIALHLLYKYIATVFVSTLYIFGNKNLYTWVVSLISFSPPIYQN